MDQQIILNGIELNEFFERLETRMSLLFKLVGNHSTPEKESSRHISRKEAAVLLKISLPTLRQWTKSGKLIAYKIGTRVLYNLDEVMAALKKCEFTVIEGRNIRS
jgi:excisionase family DNA binding protein